MNLIVKMLLAVVIVLTLVFTHAYAAKTLWGWFIVPLFGLPRLSMAQMMGLTVTLGILRHRMTGHKDDRTTEEKKKDLISDGLVYPFMALGIGWLVKYFGGL